MRPNITVQMQSLKRRPPSKARRVFDHGPLLLAL